ncbi:MAG TPA: agmatinase [Dehalococcoidia bacterium]|nr:agmatinase [Dehalococcoidia bacterium]
MPPKKGRRASAKLPDDPQETSGLGEFVGGRTPAFAGMPTFLQMPLIEDPTQLKEKKVDLAIVGAPLDWATTYRAGARFGPRAIRQANYLAGAGIHHLGLGVLPLQVLRLADAGDALCPPGDIAAGHEAIKQKVAGVLGADCIPLILGGDHSITLPSATAVADKHGHGKVGLIHFDAHADTGEDSWGVLLSHGTPMRRLIESGAYAGKNFVQVGLRGYWPPPRIIDWMKEQGMRWHLMREVEERGFDAVLDDAITEALNGPELVSLSVDIDVLDPAHAPGTGTPEPGGLTSVELLRAVRRIASELHLVGMDVVEVAPPYDSADITAAVANRVVLEVISGVAVRRTAGV